MPTHSAYDGVVVGSGPNGLAAAITLARAGCSVLVIEAQDTLGGGMRSSALTLPGFVHDICSAIHPLGVASPFMRTVPLAEHGVTWIDPPAAVAHPFDDGTAAVLEHSLARTGETLGPDAEAYERLMAPLVQSLEALVEELLSSDFVTADPRRVTGVWAQEIKTWLRAGLAFAYKDWASRAVAERLSVGMLDPENLKIELPPHDEVSIQSDLDPGWDDAGLNGGRWYGSVLLQALFHESVEVEVAEDKGIQDTIDAWSGKNGLWAKVDAMTESRITGWRLPELAPGETAFARMPRLPSVCASSFTSTRWAALAGP